eukprot:TRINITY_DN19601_c0_g1_i1.p2 TRINITY_DN19601_c0_g1~~TRINITY_DN19601_c0_g1_i1.p2  ORF type:complete len:128 (+),score=29.52 TRINITY_DN19601_c0_g1_i1:201-584(+)
MDTEIVEAVTEATPVADKDPERVSDSVLDALIEPEGDPVGDRDGDCVELPVRATEADGVAVLSRDADALEVREPASVALELAEMEPDRVTRKLCDRDGEPVRVGVLLAVGDGDALGDQEIERGCGML